MGALVELTSPFLAIGLSLFPHTLEVLDGIEDAWCKAA